MKSEILITGATGNTGQATLKRLIENNVPVRAMVRVLDERSKALEEKGVEVVQGDFSDYFAVKKALRGIKRAYFCYPFKDGLPKAATYFAKAAKENGVEVIIAMSQMNVHDRSSSPATQNHLAAEDIFNWSPVPVVHIRPGLFAWNYLSMAGPTIKQEGKFYFPNLDAKYTIVHPQDIGDVVANLLVSDHIELHYGKTYELAGPRTYTSHELVKELGELLEKETEYVPIPVEHWIENVKQDPYINDFLAKHLKEFSNDIKQGLFDKNNDHVATLTGHEPRAFSTFVKENIQAFQ
ncbi:NmrA family NAD(P)-binding protein [Flagellimonas allohymeniacidonis]|nr:NmrA family NAD(P)-binding protein [Allomuricauda hymeniacidonis]